MVRHAVFTLALLWSAPAGQARADDSDEVKGLKARVELLEAKLKLAEQENERLKQEVAKLGGKAPAGEGKRSLSDLLPADAVLKGDWRSRSPTGKTYGGRPS